MKKILSMAAIAALLATGTYANSQTLTVNAQIEAAAIVRIGEPITLGLDTNPNEFEDSIIDMGALPLNETTSIAFDVYVLTNTLGAVTMSFTEVNPLVNPGNNVALDTTYDFVNTESLGAKDALNIAAGDLIQVSNGGPRNNVKVGELTVGAKTLAASLAGDYQAVMPMTVTASL